MLDLQGILDENERAKTMKRRIEEDRKKALRVKEAEEKADKKEREKNQKSLEKSIKKGRKKMNPPPEPEGKSPVAPSPTYESGSHAPTFSRGTKRDSSYEQLSQILILTSGEEIEIQFQELILNSSMEDVLGGDTGEFIPSYNELKSFMLKVSIHLA
jgi:sRNA-binding protein